MVESGPPDFSAVPSPEDFSASFPILRELTFLNHAAVAPISGPAAEAIRDYARQAETAAYHQADWYERAHALKSLTAQLINARGAHEIAIVPNTSTGLATVARGLDWQPGDNVVTTAVEYPANRYPWEDLERFGVDLIEVPPQKDGSLDAEDVWDAVTDRTRIVAVSHVQYASGCRLELAPIAEMVHRAGGYLCVDAIQSCGVIPIDVQASGVDFLSADGHKWMLGPEGCGVLYVHEDLCEMLHPPIVGWMNMVDAFDFGSYRYEFQKDARRFEPGSYPIPGVLAMAASLELLLGLGVQEVWKRVERLTERLCEGLESRQYRIYSPRRLAHQRSGIVTFQPPFPDTRITPEVGRIAKSLEEQGILVAVREGRLRASPHFYNTPEQIDRLVEALP